MTENIFLGLGSNKGNRIDYLKAAVSKIRADADTKLEKISSVYETEPYGLKEQNQFLNAVIQISSERTLMELHPWIKNLEKEIGRQEGPKWGPREIDIDLLFYNNTVYSSEKLTVPHREVLLRDFVLVPLKEIAPEFEHPVLKIKVSEISTSELEKLIIGKISAEL
ncbi:MAG: 2-amino-4-hydroxy-6-hydroxymethyldihydropteridine diphosphokinase [Ignavibacteria bacterium]|jgi:2-amino-4-hydroxy-6-hydroxymethyldihydropteridine diphosphokinase|nr:2-amino-4-hydroxy-6-hydroxymethyldihydropteridine diphosphokinase [Ignavibacteria bacterium]MCU7502449.1 2-amino-4-hydroxy-6-hydroxymethyldihydropteridine diphosphokinase [Ignavibacteria bacterium]MCU7514986.1 2-amino-4-hydroxy-6-hydroxymethyldihydropteridine diphosphokinase [Ignavibacteria bacterium]